LITKGDGFSLASWGCGALFEFEFELESFFLTIEAKYDPHAAIVACLRGE
jgi:hypothetical protein